MREHEECRDCDEEEGHEHDFGEVFDYDRCADCSRLLEAVEAEEVARGCRRSESRPALGVMREEIGELDPDDRLAYRDRARAMFSALDPAFVDRMFSVYANDEGDES